MLGGTELKVTQLQGQFSRNLEMQRIEPQSMFVRDHWHTLTEMYSISWKAKGDDYGKTVAEILKDAEEDGCPDIILKSLVILRPYQMYDATNLKNVDINVPFTFHPHPFKPSVFQRLKSSTPSLSLYSRIKELRRIHSAELDDVTKKRWRDILLINDPHETWSNEDIRAMWSTPSYRLLLRETKGSFSLMEVDEAL